MKRILVFSLLAGLLASCTTRIADFTLVSTKNVDLTRNTSYKIENRRVVGKDKKSIIICIPTGTPNIKEAIDRSIEQAGPNCIGLSDVVIDYTSWWIPYIYGENSFTAEGNPIFKK